MNDHDTNTLRRALRAPQDPGYLGENGPAAIAEIITRGRRLRWRRRAVTAGGSLCLAAVVVGAVAGIGRLTTPSPGPAQHVVSPVGPTRGVLVPTPSPGRGHATPRPASSASPVPTSTATPTALPTATATATPTPTQSMLAPTPSRTPGATTAASSGASATSSPSASAADAITDQPSATPSTASG